MTRVASPQADAAAASDRLDHSHIVLELPAVVASIAGRTRSAAGRDLVLCIRPLARSEDAKLAQELYRDILLLDGTPDAPPPAGAPDLSAPLVRIETEGSVLRGEELWQIRLLLDLTAECVAWLRRSRREETRGLRRLLEPLEPLPALHRELDRSLDPSGTLKDAASEDLGRIRRAIHSLREKLSARLEAIQRAIGAAGSFVTLRDGRYAVAVPASERRLVPGSVLGHSGSGATLFIEPREVVEANGELAERFLDEAREEERILRELTSRAHGERRALRTDVDRLAGLDAAQAVASWARSIRAGLPELVDSQAGAGADSAAGRGADRAAGHRELKLRGARHPILAERHLRGEMGPPVPLDLKLDAEHPMLLLTGPNMGGKTVALKTVGLLALLAMAGLPVPAEGGSGVPWLDRVVCDIGDEQSLLNDVSTFLSHVRHVSEAVAGATERSLVLIDELGSGTDPVEGAALGQAVLERLLARGALTVATTHHGALKTFAHEAKGVQNASMAFDEETHRPLFTLTIGVPGRSRALQVAERFGMDPAVLERARALLPQGERDLGALLTELGRLRADASAEAEVLARTRMRLAEREASLKEALSRLESERRERKQTELQARRELLRQLESQIDEYRKRLRADRKASPGTLEEARGLARKVSDAIDSEAAASSPKEPDTREPVSAVAEGDAIYVPGLQAEGVALTAPDADGRVRVRIGGATAVLPIAQLRRGNAGTGGTAATGAGKPAATGAGKPAAGEKALPRAHDIPEVPIEIDVRGYDAEGAIEAVERFLENAAMGGIERARIIHGKGTGVLRERVKRWLESNSLVKEFRLGEIREGGTGVTIVTLQ